MDAEVWSRLPDDILWRVLLFVPAAKQFQLHSVSRRWRQLLTSAEFRKSVMAIAATAAPAPIEARVVACAVPGGDARCSSTSSHGGGKSKEVDIDLTGLVKVVDIDLTGLVPGWFWKSESYCVVAAADGLVCISNNSEVEEDNIRHDREEWVPETTRYCVLNPLTRTCTVLPNLPFQPQTWLPPTADAVTICRDWAVATYHLAGGGGGECERVSPVLLPVPVRMLPPITYPAVWEPPVLARCGGAGGAFYWYLDGRVHVLAAALDGPSVAQLGLDAASISYDEEDVFLAAYRGALFLVACLSWRRDATVAWSGVMCGVWRLALDHHVGVDVSRLDWEPVACLRLRDIERLTGLSDVDVQDTDLYICGAHGARELLCCHLLVYDANYMTLGPHSTPTPSSLLLGFNLDTGEWELVHHDQDGVRWEPNALSRTGESLVRPNLKAVELRPDLFLLP